MSDIDEKALMQSGWKCDDSGKWSQGFGFQKPVYISDALKIEKMIRQWESEDENKLKIKRLEESLVNSRKQYEDLLDELKVAWSEKNGEQVKTEVRHITLDHDFCIRCRDYNCFGECN